VKKICLMLNHFQLQDGVCRSALAIANLLAKRDDVELTLIPLFRYDNSAHKYLSSRVKVKPVFRTYFTGMSSIIKLIPAKWLYYIIVGNKYDVNIAFQFGLSQLIISAGKNDKILSIGWMHGYDYDMVMKPYYLKMDKMVCVSQCNAERLKMDLNGMVPVDYCYNPIDDEQVRKLGTSPISIKRNESVLFSTVGRISEEKGYSRLLNCVKKLKTDGYIFQLWVIGDGGLLKSLKQQAKEQDIEDYVTFMGGQNNPHAFTSKSDVFICASFSEGYSTACTEAIMLNVPVISTKVSGAEEIISEAGCGLVCDNSEDALYDTIKRVLNEPTLVTQWKETLKTTKYNFSPVRRFERFLRIVNLPSINK